jgi:hypothetical protein
MRYEARITAYDTLDHIVIAAVVLAAGNQPQASTEVVWRHLETLQGVGETDPRQWLRDILVAALETA